MLKYCESIFKTTRWNTREVMVGKIGVGGDNPIRIQSMTTSNTRDVEATIGQIIRLADAGCEIARVTVQGKKESSACEKIKNGLLQRGYEIPLVADIHFYPPAAMFVADFADKVRINPGNFVDQRAIFKTIEYDDASYARELSKIEEGFTPLVEKCKRLRRAMRIGTNHGSLSDRIMNRYGDSPRGMVESALEFARICRKLDYHDFIFSMKASNPMIMIEAYRLLVAEMMCLGWDYPLHLGVTEAGANEEGRVKSAMGIGALLMDGLGDTIRVSLTEDPWCEIDPCKRLVSFYEESLGRGIDLFEEKHRKVKRKAASRIGIVVAKTDDGLVEIADDSGRQIPLNPEFILFSPKHSPIHETRRFIDDLIEKGIDKPVIICLSYSCSQEDLVIRAAAEAGTLFCDGLGDGICLLADAPLEERNALSFNILQSARMRMTKTDYISCPGCGRTLFDLQTVAKRIREETSHLPGVKIAIMGCVVNGPGEMADADFGYVGSKPGKIDLYVGKTCVERDIDFVDADRKLIELIAAHGKWVDAKEAQHATMLKTP